MEVRITFKRYSSKLYTMHLKFCIKDGTNVYYFHTRDMTIVTIFHRIYASDKETVKSELITYWHKLPDAVVALATQTIQNALTTYNVI